MPLHRPDIEHTQTERSTLAGEIRQNILTDQWVIYAPEYANRPSQAPGHRANTAHLPERDTDCPFCTGNEHMLASIATGIVPKRHSPDFGLIARQEKEDFAGALQDALQVLHEKLDDPSYNYVIHSYSRQHSIVPYLHWYLQIRPRLTAPTGFEAGSGISINPSLPEQDAERLRGGE